MTRSFDIRITAARETGFVVWEAGEVIAAFANPQELAVWIEQRGMQVAGEAEQMAADLDGLPNIVSRPRTQPKRPWLRGVIGGE